MWDLLRFNDESLVLTLRKGGELFSYGYPWKDPIRVAGRAEGERAEAINIPDNRLFDELALRARFGACLQIFRLARSGLNGAIPTTMNQIHTEALKFALRRYEKRLIGVDDFLGMLRSAAIVMPIPSGFWGRLGKFLGDKHIEKLRQSMDALSIFHPKDENKWLEDVKPYMARILWFANDFDSIKVVSKQLAILHPAHRADFNDQGDKASSMIMRAEIEADQASLKPWQRSSAPKLQRSVRTGPVSKSPRKQQADDSEEKN
ncbi:hypothetical protein [Pseudomonas putida]|uniref:Uncharacterized protein n=1 Tax=Pseudomonas putida TaxID=303 RepID=A0A8I1JIT7_PSEPU|nr:hypothetical protein [Pseudomonas putida]MBI6882894.1 hypothetical protein [Pseudomonas putida]